MNTWNLCGVDTGSFLSLLSHSLFWCCWRSTAEDESKANIGRMLQPHALQVPCWHDHHCEDVYDLRWLKSGMNPKKHQVFSWASKLSLMVCWILLLGFNQMGGVRRTGANPWGRMAWNWCWFNQHANIGLQGKNAWKKVFEGNAILYWKIIHCSFILRRILSKKQTSSSTHGAPLCSLKLTLCISAGKQNPKLKIIVIDSFPASLW